MRIIAGNRRGLGLKTVDFEGFRPTLGRVKESLFGILTPIIEGARVLDLFAGSGALGLEAVSRGAATALFVDNNKQAIQVLEANVAKARFEDRCVVRLADFSEVGKKVARGSQFDLVFADPPYLQGFPQRAIDHLRDADLVMPEGLLCLEMERREAAVTNPVGFELVRDKKYGDTIIWIMRRAD
jgi:16S rRNA (guanine(966)-N(2))-methyltransferase RsmD